MKEYKIKHYGCYFMRQAIIKQGERLGYAFGPYRAREEDLEDWEFIVLDNESIGYCGVGYALARTVTFEELAKMKPEIKVKELTVQEVSEKLGYEVKIVK